MSSSGHQQPWSQQESYPPISAAADEDFSSLLDFDIDINLPFLDNNGFNIDNGQAGLTLVDSSPYASPNAHYGDHNSATSLQKDPSTPRSTFRSSLDAPGFVGYRNGDSASPWMANQQYQRHMSVPPTPNSSEMYPVPYLQQQQMHHTFHQYQQHQKDGGGAIYTPTESPQFMGNDISMPYAGFSDPNAFNLDPLTSPAMKPQPGSVHGSGRMLPRTAESSVAGSPIDLEFNDAANLSSSCNDRPRKTRKKAQGSTSAPGSAAPRPATAANSKKKPSSITTRNQAKTAADTFAKERQSGHSARNDLPNLSSDRGEPASTSASPQPAFEPRMGPPPKPDSVKSTPTLAPNGTSQVDGLPPATPASLMRLPNTVRSDGTAISSPGDNTEQLQSSMEELTLPEAAAPANVSTQSSQSRQGLTISTKSTPVINTNPSRESVSNTASPTAGLTPGSKGRSARNSRMRNSTSSQIISPALRPRISPSIKPLLPDGAQHHISDETHALLLASKSNYQNLLEGNHLPGVTYPSELSTNLTSKRTSHKIAEQGRRNRINTALQEMQKLLPPSASNASSSEVSPKPGATTSADCGSPKDVETSAGSKTPTTLGQGANSKAATVELAIEYINTLNSQLADKESENERLKEEMAALKAKMDLDPIGDQKG